MIKDALERYNINTKIIKSWENDLPDGEFKNEIIEKLSKSFESIELEVAEWLFDNHKSNNCNNKFNKLTKDIKLSYINLAKQILKDYLSL